jgi:hypothetical protein
MGTATFFWDAWAVQFMFTYLAGYGKSLYMGRSSRFGVNGDCRFGWHHLSYMNSDVVIGTPGEKIDGSENSEQKRGGSCRCGS